MIFNFRKIASVAASTVMITSTVALAAAASYPAPFVQNGAADVAIVYGNTLDLTAVTDITTSLSATLAEQATGTGTPTGGDFVQLDKSSNRLNLGDAINGPFGATVDDEDLTVMLADGTYVADDSDTFDYEQKIKLGSATMTHFRDSDYETLAGLSERTPVVGFKLTSGTFVLNYTLDFLDDAESDVVGTSSGGDLDDLEGSFLPMFGKEFYISDWKNGTSTESGTGKLTLLDSAVRGVIKEGETVTHVLGGESFEVSIDFIDKTSTALSINGKITSTLAKGETEKLPDGTYVGVTEIRKLEVAGELGTVEFSLGTGKLEFEHKSDIELNDDSVSDVKSYLYHASGSSGIAKINKIVIEWKTDDEEFIAPGFDLLMPGLGGLKFSMNELVRPTEEIVVIEKNQDTSMEMKVPIKDGIASIDFLYSNVTGDFAGIGKAADDRLATSHNGTLWFFEKKGGSDYHTGFVVSYNTSTSSQSYYLDLNVKEDTGDNRNETTIKNIVTGEIWDERVVGDTFDLGDVSFTIDTLEANSTDQWAVLRGGPDITFNTVYTKGGLRIYLPFLVTNDTIAYDGDGWIPSAADLDEAILGALNVTGTGDGLNVFSSKAGHGYDTYFSFFDGEDKDDNLGSGVQFNITIDDTSSNALQVKHVNEAGTGGPTGLETGDSSKIYEMYIIDDVAPRALHYTDPDEDWVQILYPEGDSQTYTEVFLSDTTSVSAGSELGTISVMDTELAASGMQSKNLIVVGGSCINSAAATLLGSSSPMCGDAWTAATGAGAGEYIVQTFSNPWSGAKVATLVAGYGQGDTLNAATFFRTQTDVTTDVNTKWKGTTGVSASIVTA
ncbi:MAG: hypothetical protein IIA87_02160 [Nanoarchaeota archaeon]|nr:hypothetical protein [Nanoarchaeota archaeon]